jgi:hypothetical protein
MWLRTIQLKNIRSFVDSGHINLSKGINVLVGANSSGKSTILRTPYLLQGQENQHDTPRQFLRESLRAGAEQGEVRLLLADPAKQYFPGLQPQFDMRAWKPEFVFTGGPSTYTATMRKNNPPNEMAECSPLICAQREPHNFIYPYFSRRKPPNFDLVINHLNQSVVEEAFTHLPAKVDRLSNPYHADHKKFEEICSLSLGLRIGAAAYQNGKHAGLTLEDGAFLPVEQMGEGTLGVLALLAHLCIAKGKLFLIEEPENDIHPKALKALLDFIVAQAQHNQFIISTHSNIVLKILGSAPGAQVFYVEMKQETPQSIPTSTCTLLGDDPESRIRLLEDLGYYPSDLYLYDAYLVLEESSAERVIRDFMVPYMFPNLQGKLRTIAAGGISKVEASFHDFHRLFVYLHTAPQYRDRAWVAVDAGADGEQVVSDLRQKFKDWTPNHFQTWTATQFEDYYPPQFKAQADTVLAIKNKLDRQKQKGTLAEAVAAWCVANPDAAKQWFRESAKDVLALLGEIEKSLSPKVPASDIPPKLFAPATTDIK